MYDVAFLLGTSVTSDVRRDIERDAVDEYYDIVGGPGTQNYTREDCWRSYRQNMFGTLMAMVIGCGALEMSEPELVSQSREMLSRTLTAVEELDSREFLPPREPFLAKGWGFSALSRCGNRAYRLALRLGRKRGG